MNTKWLIWSNEHRGWWKPDGWGYTTHVAQAGRYDYAEAAIICRKANFWHKDGQPPDETMVPESTYDKAAP